MVHTYSQNGRNIALDVESGAVHLLSGAAFVLLDGRDSLPDACPEDALAALSRRFSRAELLEAYDELLTLKREGTLFSSAQQELPPMGDPPIKAMCLHVAHDCNIRCEYCFAATGDFSMGRELMPAEVGMRAIDFLIERSGARRNLEVDFFGGEPLLNLPAVREITDYACARGRERDKRFRFTLTTNALLLNEDNTCWICDTMDNVVLSLDGRRGVNDRVRRRVDGGGTYDAILPKLLRFRELRGERDYYVRGTFTRHNLDFADDVMHMLELGFPNVSVEPVVAPEDAPYAIRESDLPAVFAEYERLAMLLLERRGRGEASGFFHFNIDLAQGPCVIKRMRGCGAGCEYVAVTPAGELYPCHQFVGVDGFMMGRLTDGDIDRQLSRRFLSADIAHKDECSRCWAKYYCSGGCNANNHLYAGSLLRPYKLACEMEKKRVECAIMMKSFE